MQARVVDFLLAAGNCLLKAQRQTHLHILAALGTRAPRRSAAAESTAENAPENITKIPEVGKAAAVSVAGARRRIERCLAELIVLCLVRVGQHGVRLVDLLEVLLGIRVAGVQIGVILFGELAVGALDRLRIGVPVYAEYFIVISVFCHMIYTVASAPRSAPCGRCDSFGGAFSFSFRFTVRGRGIRRIPEGSHNGDGAACPAGGPYTAQSRRGRFQPPSGNCWSRISEEPLTCPEAHCLCRRPGSLLLSVP